jgi:hypothetical protein
MGNKFEKCRERRKREEEIKQEREDKIRSIVSLSCAVSPLLCLVVSVLLFQSGCFCTGISVLSFNQLLSCSRGRREVREAGRESVCLSV